jgi:hypothetical protein
MDLRTTDEFMCFAADESQPCFKCKAPATLSPAMCLTKSSSPRESAFLASRATIREVVHKLH